jgi:hypothetical protein
VSHRQIPGVRHEQPATAALLLADIGEHDLAEAALVAAPQRIDGANYLWLVPLAKALEAHECWVGATAVYRALLDAILLRAYAGAYGHAARYWQCLEIIAASGASLGPLATHESYVAGVRQTHARKTSFWARVKEVNEPRGDESSHDAFDDA